MNLKISLLTCGHPQGPLPVTGQNGSGQNGTDKMVAIFGIDYISSEFNTYLVTKDHK